MPKIEIEIPNWVDGRHLYVFAGIELVAFKHLNKEWKVKVSRCNGCGKCCEKINCKDLGKDKMCSLGAGRPFSCCIGVSVLKSCTEVFE